MAQALTPRGCWVRRIEIQPKGAEIGYDCGGPKGGGRGQFPLPRGQAGWGNYPSKFVRGVRSVSFRGMSVSGHGASIGFVLMPAHAVCQRDGREISCQLKGDTSLPSLQGARRRRRR